MRVIELDDPSYLLVEELLADDPEETELDVAAGIECDADDLESQRAEGDEDPIHTLELIAQWSPEGKQGLLDLFVVRESGLNKGEDGIEHFGSLFGFSFEGEQPDLDRLLPRAVALLNDRFNWAEFAIDEEGGE